MPNLPFNFFIGAFGGFIFGFIFGFALAAIFASNKNLRKYTSRRSHRKISRSKVNLEEKQMAFGPQGKSVKLD
jgi:hypothetical protein